MGIQCQDYFLTLAQGHLHITFIRLIICLKYKLPIIEQNKIVLRTPKGYKAREETTCYIIDGIYDSVKFINDIQTNEI